MANFLDLLPAHERAITALMTRPNIPHNIKIDPEALECIVFADRMRGHTAQGRYKGIWGHTPNESKRGLIHNLVLRAMGMIPGATDFIFMWEKGGCVIEFKTPERMRWNDKGKYVKAYATKQSDSQKFYQQWCDFCKIPYFLCYTAQEAEEKLKGLGALS